MPSVRHTYCISNIVIQDYNKIKHLHSVNIENKSEDQNKTQLILELWKKLTGKRTNTFHINADVLGLTLRQNNTATLCKRKNSII